MNWLGRVPRQKLVQRFFFWLRWSLTHFWLSTSSNSTLFRNWAISSRNGDTRSKHHRELNLRESFQMPHLQFLVAPPRWSFWAHPHHHQSFVFWPPPSSQGSYLVFLASPFSGWKIIKIIKFRPNQLLSLMVTVMKMVKMMSISSWTLSLIDWSYVSSPQGSSLSRR